MSFSFFPNPAEYLKKYQKDEDYLKIMENKNISTTDKGKLVVRQVSRRLTQGVKNLQERIQEFKNKANSTVDVNLINKLKLDISSNVDLHENSISPLNNLFKNRLSFGIINKVENNSNFFMEKEITKQNFEYLIQNNNNKGNNSGLYQGPNDILDKNK